MLTLLGAEGAHDRPGRLFPQCIEGGRVPGLLPITVRQADRVAKRIHFPLAFAYPWIMFRLIFHCPLERRRRSIAHKCVRIGVDQNHARLAANETFEQLAQPIVLLCQGEVRHYLRRGITQPHGIDVAGDDIGIRLAIVSAGEDGSVQRVGKAILEDGGERYVRNLFFYSFDDDLDGFAGEMPGPYGRPSMRQVQRL